MILANIFVLIIFNIYAIKADDCEYSTPQGILDLKTFGYKDRPKYTDVRDTSPTALLTYSFNGCFAYSTKDSCQNAAACVTEEVSKTVRLIARQAGRTFTYNQGLSTMLYTDGAGTIVQVFLVCGTTESVQATRNNDKSFLLHIESPCACPGNCTYIPDKSPNGLTGGAIFIIILICIISTYLIVSVLFLRFVKHQRGVDLIPNRTLWLQIGINSIHGYLYSLVNMFVSMLNLSICYLFMFGIRTITCASSCIYDVGNGQQLDIRPLGIANGKRPKYDNIPNSSPVPHTFNWNACFPYSKSDGGNCSNAAACYTDRNTGKSILIAKQSDATFEYHESVNTLIYHSSNLLLTVYLTCTDSEKETINGRQDDQQIFNIYIQSRCCCPGKCHYSSGSIGGGAVFIIILLVLIFVYIVGGMFFLRYSRGATGPDMIPNRLLWLGITSYAVNGLRYSIQIIRHRSLAVDYGKL